LLSTIPSKNDESTAIIHKGPFNPDDIDEADGGQDDYFDSIAIDGI